MEEEMNGDESGRPQPVKWNVYFRFKMDGQDVILGIQWLKNFSVW